MRSLLKATFSDWYEDRAQRMGAALAYYTIFALTPGLVILMALAGLLLSESYSIKSAITDDNMRVFSLTAN